MKKTKKLTMRQWWVLSILLLFFGGSVIAVIFDSYRVFPSQGRIIDGRDGEQYYVDNDGSDRFIPNRTTAELHSFINAVAGTTGTAIDGKMSNGGSLPFEISVCRIKSGSYGAWNTSGCSCSGSTTIGNKTQNCSITGVGVDYSNCVIGCNNGATNSLACTSGDISCNTCSINVVSYTINNPEISTSTDPIGGYRICMTATNPNETAPFTGNNPNGDTFNLGINWPSEPNPYCFDAHEYQPTVKSGGNAHYELTVNPSTDNTQCSKDWKSWAVSDWGSWNSLTNCEFQRDRSVTCPTGGCDNALKPQTFQLKVFATPQTSPPEFAGGGSVCE